MYTLVMDAKQPGNHGKMEYLYSLYFSFARTHLIHVFKDTVLNNICNNLKVIQNFYTNQR